MTQLPIYDVLDDIKTQLNNHNRLVLQAPPGAGKTTAVPIALLQQDWLQNRQIIVLEPRRIAARNAAARMAYLLNEKVGETVGYQIRQDKCLSRDTKILVVTEGILTRKLQADPEQANTALIIFDEFHERSLDADLSLALCLQSQQILNENLKILVMSATLNTTSIAKLLDDAPIIQSEGRSFPVAIHYLEKSIQQTGQFHISTSALMTALLTCLKKIVDEHTGSCLVFLPGVAEINRLFSLLHEWLNENNIKNIVLARLHGSLNKQYQDQAIKPSRKGDRKIVLATNIAETSLTIDGIDCVVDSGLERVLQYQPATAMNCLQTQFISLDSANQRAGRAGRLSAGHCYRLWTSQQQARLTKHSQAEILRSDLSALMLELANWGVKECSELAWIDLPPRSSVEQARTLLQQLSAIDKQGKITVHGKNMLRLGASPRLAHMMLSAVDIHQTYHACLIAAILSEKDLFLASSNKSADIHDRLSILLAAKIDDKNINRQLCKQILQTADDFFKRIQSIENIKQKEDVDSSLSGVLLAHAYPDRIAKQRHKNQSRYLLCNGKGAVIAENLQQHDYAYLVVANMDAKTAKSDAVIYLFAEIDESQIVEYFSDLIEQLETTQWNHAQQRVDVTQTSSIGKIILQQQLITSPNKTAIHACLLDAVKAQSLDCLYWSSQAVQFKQRVECLRYGIGVYTALKNQYKEEAVVNFSDEYLLQHLDDWLLPHLTHENSIKQLQKLDMLPILESQLSWSQLQLLNQLVPATITVPSGSNIKIDYSDAKQPVLAVRLQEVFGLYETPCILNGQLQLMMHLLSPAHRPMQVTQDLNNFWRSTYHDVKKELRGKYKRHYWPDDPFTAQATSKTKKNMHR